MCFLALPSEKLHSTGSLVKAHWDLHTVLGCEKILYWCPVREIFAHREQTTTKTTLFRFKMCCSDRDNEKKTECVDRQNFLHPKE